VGNGASSNVRNEERYFLFDQIRPVELDIVPAAFGDDSPASQGKSLQAFLRLIPVPAAAAVGPLVLECPLCGELHPGRFLR